MIDAILIRHRIFLGFIMMHHMMSYCESMTKVLPYRRFLTKVFKEFKIDLTCEKNIQVPSIYDTYNVKIERSDEVQATSRWLFSAQI